MHKRTDRCSALITLTGEATHDGIDENNNLRNNNGMDPTATSVYIQEAETALCGSPYSFAVVHHVPQYVPWHPLVERQVFKIMISF